MNNKTDVLVVGSGPAGLFAAVVAAQRGKTVTLVTQGAGSLAICGSTVDVLGYAQGQRIDSAPWQALATLPPEHPYSMVGEQGIRTALAIFSDLCAQAGLPLRPADQESNTLVPSIIGTLKPSWLCPAAGQGNSLLGARRVLVAGIEGFKDCHPALVARQLKRYPELGQATFHTVSLIMPPQPRKRTLSPLDVARFVDSAEGLQWLLASLRPYAGTADVLVLPPVCGIQHSGNITATLSAELHCPVVEMLSIPPAVGGLRLRAVLCRKLATLGVNIVENATIVRAETEGTRCIALISKGAGGERRYAADQFIIATGGILGGGLAVSPDSAQETIFGIPLPLPASIEERSQEAILGDHYFTRMGVRVNPALCPVDEKGLVLFDNVHFAGRALGGYDFATEKSGLGVAFATGWAAAQKV